MLSFLKILTKYQLTSKTECLFIELRKEKHSYFQKSKQIIGETEHSLSQNN